MKNLLIILCLVIYFTSCEENVVEAVHGCFDSAACNYSTSYTFPCITPEQQDVMEVVGHFIHDIYPGIIDGGLMRTCFNNDWVATDGYNYGYAEYV